MTASDLRDLEAALGLLNRTLKEVQQERDQLRGERDVLRRERNEIIRSLNELTNENDHLKKVLVACQKALKQMQAQRDRAREGKR